MTAGEGGRLTQLEVPFELEAFGSDKAALSTPKAIDATTAQAEYRN